MARSSRILRNLTELLVALDHHQFLLRQSLHGLREDPAYLKTLALELRTLICLSTGTEGLLWRVADALNISDVVQLQARSSVNRDHPLARGLSIAKIPLWRPGEGPPGLPVKDYRLRDVIKKHEAIYVAQLSDRIFTHELLIGAIAGQMAGHEAEGLDYSLVQLNQILINQRELYFGALAFDAELTLQIGERLLDCAEKQHGFYRSPRPAGFGDVTLLIRFAQRESILGSVHIASFRSPIAEAMVTCSAWPRYVRFTLEKRGAPVAQLEAAYSTEWDKNTDSIFALSYSSAHRQARAITNGRESNPPISCDFGWLDARELRPPEPHRGFETFVNVRSVMTYSRLLSPRECGELLQISPDMRELMPQNPSKGPFPT